MKPITDKEMKPLNTKQARLIAFLAIIILGCIHIHLILTYALYGMFLCLCWVFILVGVRKIRIQNK